MSPITLKQAEERTSWMEEEVMKNYKHHQGKKELVSIMPCLRTRTDSIEQT